MLRDEKTPALEPSSRSGNRPGFVARTGNQAWILEREMPGCLNLCSPMRRIAGLIFTTDARPAALTARRHEQLDSRT